MYPAYESAIDRLDREGRLLGSTAFDIRFAAIGHPLRIGPDGKLYTVSMDPYPRIRRYHVEVAR